MITLKVKAFEYKLLFSQEKKLNIYVKFTEEPWKINRRSICLWFLDL